jgi:hypothetical protein
MRVVNDTLTAIALSNQYPVMVVGDFSYYATVHGHCAQSITLYDGDTIALYTDWQEFQQAYNDFLADKRYRGLSDHFICVYCKRRMHEPTEQLDLIR